eukprot:4459004-Amphidinium_carterae.1
MPTALLGASAEETAVVATFAAWNADKDGAMTFGEFKRMWSLLDKNMSAKELDQLFKLVDKDGDGTVDKYEWIDWVFQRTHRSEMVLEWCVKIMGQIESGDTVEVNGSIMEVIDMKESKYLLRGTDGQETWQDVDSPVLVAKRRTSETDDGHRQMIERVLHQDAPAARRGGKDYNALSDILLR